jgi:hypothetical protein
MHKSADRRPDILREFDLARVWIIGDRRQEDDVLGRNIVQGSEVALCDS